jgi:hypothetical protein
MKRPLVHSAKHCKDSRSPDPDALLVGNQDLAVAINQPIRSIEAIGEELLEIEQLRSKLEPVGNQISVVSQFE